MTLVLNRLQARCAGADFILVRRLAEVVAESRGRSDPPPADDGPPTAVPFFLRPVIEGFAYRIPDGSRSFASLDLNAGLRS
jgi:hypothetical protein